MPKPVQVGQVRIDVEHERLFACCHAYLRFAQDHPQRYRTMFGGVWDASTAEHVRGEDDVAALGGTSTRLLTEALGARAAAGHATSTNLHADAVALWLGMDGPAHQRAVTVVFPWPPDIAGRIITALADLD